MAASRRLSDTPCVILSPPGWAIPAEHGQGDGMSLHSHVT